MMKDKTDEQGYPAFAVIGRVNKGKSSVVSTLAEDSTVKIAREARTTRDVTAYRWTIDGKIYYEVLDTPGFERAEAALEWIRSRASNPTQRLDAVRAFMNSGKEADSPKEKISSDSYAFKNSPDTSLSTDEFEMEHKLLGPVMDGAAVVYVADATRPWRNHYRAELEILKWTGRPLIGILNRTGERYEDEWRAYLRDWCHTVRVFDAHHAGFNERVGLLRAFRELAPEFSDKLDAAINAIEEDWKQRESDAIEIISDLVVSALTYSSEEAINEAGELSSLKPKIEKSFHDALRKMENRAHRKIMRLYRHEHLDLEIRSLLPPSLEEDLFTGRVWRNLGLNSRQLAAGGAIGGATIGAIGDVAAGGLSFGVFTIGGALLGGAGGIAAALGRISSPAELAGKLRGGKLLVKIGPHKNPKFGSVLLDRALLLLLGLQGRPHAVREKLCIDVSESENESEGIVRNLSQQTWKNLAKILDLLHKAARRNRRISIKERMALEDVISSVLEELKENKQG